jgi:hypothetical protein
MPTIQELAFEREQAAADLEDAIAALGVKHGRYQRVTQQLGDRMGADLTRRLEVPIILHLVRAGLSAFLERKLAGRPGSLLALVEEQHQTIERSA